MILLEERIMSVKWRVAFVVTLLPLIVFESIRCYQRFLAAPSIGISMFVLSCCIIAAMVVVLVLTSLGKRRSPFYLAIPIFINMFTLTIVPYTSVERVGLNPISLYGMSEIMFYGYVFVQLALITLLIVYYFTEYLFGFRKRNDKTQREKDFDEFLKTPKENEQDSWSKFWDNK